jgi:hypothetical protein
MERWWLLLALAACGPAQKSADPPPPPEVPAVKGLRPAAAFASIADGRVRAAALFSEASIVFQHPRCANCHPADKLPRQGDDSRVHEPPVSGGAEGRGVPAMMCSSCHQLANFELVGMPGADDWHLAPPSMQFLDTTAAAICARMKDPAQNGGKTLEQIVDHVARDALVAWGWEPGAGREPAPGDSETLAGLMRAWVDAGAHCP